MTVMLVFTLFSVALSGRVLATPQQLERHASTSSSVFVGRVLAPGGRPAAGAVVVTSAGGEAVSAADGSFALAADVPLEAESVEVSAVLEDSRGRGSLAARARLLPSALAPTTPVGTLLLLPTPACAPKWLPAIGEQPGTNDTIESLVVFDDGSGPGLYAGGVFRAAGGVEASCVVRWDGTRWSPLGTGVAPLGGVHALAVFDDGSGAGLYAGGSFSTAGGAPASCIAKWNGATWSALGSGIAGIVEALTVFDDGAGPGLYAGGGFTNAGGAAANRIARWDGASWAPLASGMNSAVDALAEFDDGSGSALYAAGAFTTAGGVAASRIARWDGASWSALGSGMNADVLALAVFDDGTGPALYAGGMFTSAGGVAVSRIARWDGSSWSALGTGIGGPSSPHVNVLTVVDLGGGPMLCAGGVFATAGGASARRVAGWNGSSWSPLAAGMYGSGGGTIFALAELDDGAGPALYAAGNFEIAGDLWVNNIARWDGASWSALEKGPDRGVHEMVAFDDGNGSALYATGDFRTAGGVEVEGILRWDGTHCHAVGSGLDDFVRALAVHDDGSGPSLHAAYTIPGGVLMSGVARLDGASWSELGTFVNGWVYALQTFDDGSGPALYAGGYFTTAGGVVARGIARWDGASWSALGSGIGGTGSGVRALAMFDDGTGPALYAGGDFSTAGGLPAFDLARWDGTSWSAVGGGFPSAISYIGTLQTFDDGTGTALYVSGESFAPTRSARVARWDGSSWSLLPGTFYGAIPNTDVITSLVGFDDGTGPALYAGGTFTAVDGLAARRLARWDGASWSALGNGTSDSVYSLAVFDAGNGAKLCVGGAFGASPSRASFFARWGCADRIRRQGW